MKKSLFTLICVFTVFASCKKNQVQSKQQLPPQESSSSQSPEQILSAQNAFFRADVASEAGGTNNVPPEYVLTNVLPCIHYLEYRYKVDNDFWSNTLFVNRDAGNDHFDLGYYPAGSWVQVEVRVANSKNSLHYSGQWYCDNTDSTNMYEWLNLVVYYPPDGWHF